MRAPTQKTDSQTGPSWPKMLPIALPSPSSDLSLSLSRLLGSFAYSFRVDRRPVANCLAVKVAPIRLIINNETLAHTHTHLAYSGIGNAATPRSQHQFDLLISLLCSKVAFILFAFAFAFALALALANSHSYSHSHAAHAHIHICVPLTQCLPECVVRLALPVPLLQRVDFD